MEEERGVQEGALKQREREVAKLQKECATQRKAAKDMCQALRSAEMTAEHARLGLCILAPSMVAKSPSCGPTASSC